MRHCRRFRKEILCLPLTCSKLGTIIENIEGKQHRSKALTNQSALSAYLQALKTVEKELDGLKAKASDHFGTHPDDINWGHVGDLNHILGLLKQANGKGEQE